MSCQDENDAENRLDTRMMAGLSKDDAQRNRDSSQDDTRMIKPKILEKTKPKQKTKTKKVVIILIYRMTELNHRMIRGPSS